MLGDPCGRLVGTGNALYFAMSSKVIRGEEAQRMGIVQEVVEGDVLGRALEFAQDLATNVSPTSLAAMKAQIWNHAALPIEASCPRCVLRCGHVVLTGTHKQEQQGDPQPQCLARFVRLDAGGCAGAAQEATRQSILLMNSSISRANADFKEGVQSFVQKRQVPLHTPPEAASRC